MNNGHPPNRFILYDYLQVAGGAERLTLTLAEALPEFQLVVSRVYADAQALSLGALSPRCLGSGVTRWMGRIPEALWQFRTATRFLRHAEAVIYSGFYAPLATRNQLTGRKIYYCHTPPRYAYDLATVYRNTIPILWRPVFDAGICWLRHEYEQALAGMDAVIANSFNVQRRLKQYLGIEAQVIHPPIDIARFRWLGAGDFFVSLARLTKPKRVDRIVQAFLRMPDQKLVVVSGGPELDNLRCLAAGARNIHFTGWQSEMQLQEWIGNARAAIYLPVDEDFGMSPVEAMAAGKPVIGVAQGGLLETILDGQTGILLPAEPVVDQLITAIRQLTAQLALAMRPACEARARLFSRDIFINQMRLMLKGGSVNL